MSPSRHADDPGRLLRATLTTNAVVSGLCGAGLVAAGSPLHGVLGLPGPAPLIVFGALLLVFAAQVWRARREPVDRRQAQAILVMDVAYVVATAVFLLVWPQVLSPLGRWLAIAVAEVVALFALGEYVGIRRLARSTAAA